MECGGKIHSRTQNLRSGGGDIWSGAPNPIAGAPIRAYSGEGMENHISGSAIDNSGGRNDHFRVRRRSIGEGEGKCLHLPPDPPMVQYMWFIVRGLVFWNVMTWKYVHKDHVPNFTFLNFSQIDSVQNAWSQHAGHLKVQVTFSFILYH